MELYQCSHAQFSAFIVHPSELLRIQKGSNQKAGIRPRTIGDINVLFGQQKILSQNCQIGTGSFGIHQILQRTGKIIRFCQNTDMGCSAGSVKPCLISRTGYRVYMSLGRASSFHFADQHLFSVKGDQGNLSVFRYNESFTRAQLFHSQSPLLCNLFPDVRVGADGNHGWSSF